MVRRGVPRAVWIHGIRFNRGHQTTDAIDIFLLQRSTRTAELSDELSTNAVNKAQVVTDQLAYTLAVAVVNVGRDIINFRDPVFGIEGIGMQTVVEQVAGGVVARVADAV